jgi:hypothetical protein
MEDGPAIPSVPPRDEGSEYSSEDLWRLFKQIMKTRWCLKLSMISVPRSWIAGEFQVAVEQS